MGLQLKAILYPTLFISVVSNFLICCTGNSRNIDQLSHYAKTLTDTLSTSTSKKEGDSSFLNKTASLTEIYVLAIKDFIAAVKTKDHIEFESLYINQRKSGQPDDFPAIDLPNKIENTQIILLPQEETNKKASLFTSNSPLINLIGWVDSNKADFVFFTFYPGFEHKFSCNISYFSDSKNKAYTQNELTIDVLVKDNNGTPTHFEVYKNGKYIGNKSL